MELYCPFNCDFFIGCIDMLYEKKMKLLFQMSLKLKILIFSAEWLITAMSADSKASASEA